MGSLTEQVPERYDVFINHRGPDTKKNLASLIYRELRRYGLHVFLDKGELSVGDTLPSAIRRAIHSASVHIAIFSKRYAESRWCLEELCWILRLSHQRTILPIFCDVEPFHLRNVGRGPYADAFEEHKRKGKDSMEVVEKWKGALKEASYICGIVFKNDESDHGEILDNVTKIVLRKVKKDLLEVAKYPVGLEEALEYLQTKFLKESGRKVIGIGGTGGVGKSTLAKHIFNMERSAFERSCYLSSVRKSADLTCLQRQLLRDLLGIDRDITNSEEGKRILRNGLEGLNVLIALDDVDNVQQINSLSVIDVVGSKSLILITSRDKVILEAYFAHAKSSANTFLHDVKQLERKHARELFCRHAFLQSKPFEGYEDLVEKFLEICGGVPLCLKILGEQLSASNLDKKYWKHQLEMFYQGFPLQEMGTVINTLKWSYEAMGNAEKEMLLDIGYFLAGEDSELAVRVLEGLGYDGLTCLQSLRQKCLVDFDNDVESQDVMESRGAQNLLHVATHPGQVDVTRRHNYDDNPFSLWYHLAGVLPWGSRKIIMQNQVRELVRHIVREELHTLNKPLRVSCCEDIEKMLQLQDGSNICRIRGIRIPKGQSPPRLSDNISITGVRLLVVEHPINLLSYFNREISGNLVWLRLFDCQVSLPSAISLKNLRVLELRGSSDSLEKFFNSLNEIPSELSELNIHAWRGSSEDASSSRQPIDKKKSMKSSDRNIHSTHQAFIPSFSRFIRSIGFTSMLTKIILKDIEFLESLPIDFSDLRNLIHLDLSGWTNLTKLPNAFCELIHLQYLALRNCSCLIIPGDILGDKIFSLKYMDFKGCAQLDILPFGIAFQKSLVYLNLLETDIRELPFNFGLLDKLEQLRIGSPKLTELPISVAALDRLKELILFECNNLDQITPIENLHQLERLGMYRLAVKRNPPGIVRLKSMKVLAIDYCPLIEFSFNNGMSILRDFTLNHTSISSICFPRDCPRLEIVNLSYNLQLIHVEGLPSGLVRLNLKGCRELKTLRNLSELEHLKFLNINGCVKLEALNVKGLKSLEQIKAEECWELQGIESLSELERLNCLHISTLNEGLISDAFLEILNIEDVILNSFGRHTVLDIPGTTTARSPVRLKNFHSYNAILMCFITTNEFSRFTVRFEPSNSNAQYEEYNTVYGNGTRGRRVHMYMWTEDSRLFKDENFYNEIVVYNNDNATELDGEKGWIAEVDSKTRVLEVCNRIVQEIKSLEVIMNWSDPPDLR